MRKFWILLEQSTITQGVITSSVVVSCAVLWISGRPIPSDLMQLTFAIVAFWFGSKTSQNQMSAKIEALLDRLHIDERIV